MSAKVNPLALVGLDCPACQGAQFCEPECICPVCFPDRFMTSHPSKKITFRTYINDYLKK